MPDVTEFACAPKDFSCLLGSLFCEIEPPCEVTEPCDFAVCGYTYSGQRGKLIVRKDILTFYGDPKDLQAAREGACLERKCKLHG